MSTQASASPTIDTQIILQALRSAVGKALDKKRRLGQYAVVWSDNAPLAFGDDVPAELLHARATQK